MLYFDRDDSVRGSLRAFQLGYYLSRPGGVVDRWYTIASQAEGPGSNPVGCKSASYQAVIWYSFGCGYTLSGS